MVVRRRRSSVWVALLCSAVTLSACTTSVAGQAVRAPGPRTPPSISARDLLLQDGETTPFGPATAGPLGSSYFTSARPPECAAALLFEGSPLRPPGSADHAETAYQVGGQASYAESVDVYNDALDPQTTVWKGFTAVSDCLGEAIGVSSLGDFKPMRLSGFAIPSPGVLAWTMTRDDWNCDYGLAVVPRVALLIAACDAKPGFPMADWAAKRQAQIDGRLA
jgi:hypothetical protein